MRPTLRLVACGEWREQSGYAGVTSGRATGEGTRLGSLVWLMGQAGPASAGRAGQCWAMRKNISWAEWGEKGLRGVGYRREKGPRGF
jgi:hypothetical protein